MLHCRFELRAKIGFKFLKKNFLTKINLLVACKYFVDFTAIQLRIAENA